MSRSFVTQDAEQTERLAAAVGSRLLGGEVLLLCGDLGAGKTCFVRGLARGLGIAERVVKSPSYNILHQYDGGRLTLQHFDAYFVREAEEFRRDGIDEFLAQGQVVVVEWGDRFIDEFPTDAYVIRLEILGEDERRVTLTRIPEPAWLRELLDCP